jgi:hypothetical protein
MGKWTMKQFDCVTLLEDIPSEGLKAGAVGTILDVYVAPSLAYEVEFCDENGVSITPDPTFTLRPEQVCLYWSAPEGSGETG